MSDDQSTAGGLSNRVIGLIFSGVFALVLIAQLPATIATSLIARVDPRFTYGEASGTLWRGNIADAGFNGISLGDIEYKVSPLSLLTLGVAAETSLSGGAITGDGNFRISMAQQLSIRDASFDVDLARVANKGLLGEPVRGGARISASSFHYSRAGCKNGQGKVWTNAINGTVARFNGAAMPLAGPIGCDEGNLQIALSGSSADGTADVKISVRPDFTYEVTATVKPLRDDVSSALILIGFEAQNGTLTYGSAGALKGPGS